MTTPSTHIGYSVITDGEETQRFAVFRVDDGYYWQLIADDYRTPRGMVNGPFDTSLAAYQHATQHGAMR